MKAKGRSAPGWQISSVCWTLIHDISCKVKKWKKNGMRSTCSVKVGTDDENTNVHLVFFFSPVCEGGSERASRRRSADNVCRWYRWRSPWMQADKWAGGKQQGYYCALLCTTVHYCVHHSGELLLWWCDFRPLKTNLGCKDDDREMIVNTTRRIDWNKQLLPKPSGVLY